ncbi:uncharacterized protein LOC120568522 [Perca fluviatilis]|nr:uncharacterized protein LOC120568522 [Perca fluviatilis]
MLFLPAAALCCLCSALAAMATQLIQDDLTLTRRVGGYVSFNCRGTEQCDLPYVFWYQKKDTETFTRILYIRRDNGVIEKERYNHPQKDDFSAVNEEDGCELQIQKVKLDHSATYYCSCYKDDPHSEKCSLQPEQKPPDEQMSNSVCDRKRSVNHSPGSHISPPSQPESLTVLGSNTLLSNLLLLYVGEKDHFTAESGIQLHQGTGDPVSSNTEGEEDQQARPLQHTAGPSVQSIVPLRFLYHSVSLWETSWWYYIFGSGTKLIVSDEPVVKPVVSVYPAASRAHLEGKSSLLCLASAMFPPLVQFSWKRRNETGPLEELSSDDIEQLEIRESGHTASILLIHQKENSTYKYRCDVLHEGGTVEAQTEQEVPAPAASCPPERDPPDQLALEEADLSFQSQCRVKLFCLLYTQLIVKSLVYCCGLSLLMILRNKGPSTSCSHAD